MNKSDPKPESGSRPRRGMWTAIGLILGAGLGVLLQNIIAGAAGGLLIGAILDLYNHKK